MNTINTSSVSPSYFSSGFDGDDGGCTTASQGPHKPSAFHVMDGVDEVSESGGSVTCPDGTKPNVTIDGQTVEITCVPEEKPPAKGPKPGAKAPILD